MEQLVGSNESLAVAKKYDNLYVFIHVIGDLIILNLSYYLGHFFAFNYLTLHTSGTLAEQLVSPKYVNLGLFINLIYLVAAQMSGTFNMYRNTRFSEFYSSLTKLFVFQVLLMAAYILVFKDQNDTYKVSRGVLLAMYFFAYFFTTIWRFGLIKVIRYYRSKGHNTQEVIIIGAGESGQEMKRILSNKAEYGLKVLGFFDDDKESYPPKIQTEILGTVNEVQDFALKNEVSEIFCALPYEREEQIMSLIKFADKNLVRLRIVPDFRRLINTQLARVNINQYGLMPVLTIREEPLENQFNRLVKRIFDFSFSLLTIVFILSWMVPIIGLIIKLTSKGPIFFKQKRSGERNEIFEVLKFRTMYVNNDAHTKQAEKNDPRITPIGAFLRRTNLDELPQFWNVFTGHMSVIGPRPHMLKHTEEYSEIIDNFMVRHLVKPGITGWAQVNGFRGETKEKELMEERVAHDVWYIENWTFGLDLKIILLTIFNMWRGEDRAY